MDSAKKILYDNVPDDVFKIITEEQSRLKIELKKHVGLSYTISRLIRKSNQNSINGISTQIRN